MGGPLLHPLDDILVGVLFAIQHLPNPPNVLCAFKNNDGVTAQRLIRTKKVDGAVIITSNIHAVDFVFVPFHNRTSKIFPLLFGHSWKHEVYYKELKLIVFYIITYLHTNYFYQQWYHCPKWGIQSCLHNFIHFPFRPKVSIIFCHTRISIYKII